MTERTDTAHPSPEEWVAYLYGEVDSTSRQALTDHLFRCATCREQLDRWRGAMFALDRWAMPEHAPAPPRRRHLEWVAVAASFVLVLFGFGIGRFFGPKPIDVEALRADITDEVRASLETELRDALYRELTDEWRAGLAAAQQQLYLDLRRDLAQGLDATTRRLTENLRQERAASLSALWQAQERRDTELYEAIQQLDDARRNELAALEARIADLAAVTSSEIMKTRARLAAWTTYRPVSRAVAR